MVPFHITQEVAPPLGGLDESMLHRDRGEDILTTVRVFSCFDCPPIPLCWLIPHARVCGLRSDVTGLIAAFAGEGYIKEKGAFIVSLRTCQLVDSNVTGTNSSLFCIMLIYIDCNVFLKMLVKHECFFVFFFLRCYHGNLGSYMEANQSRI